MCVLCVIQKWSRRVVTMLPWLVIPLIGLWALSQLLPPAFRFEITSPRLACVLVLLVTLFWYEILMPQLSAWRVRRNTQLRERKRFEAIELQKLKKIATRRCRNCLTPYRDQNPGGGRFMCSYCGHISKRPVLDLPVLPSLRISNPGIIKDLVGRGKMNSKGSSENGWIGGQDWLENGNWIGGSVSGRSSSWQKNRSGFGGDDNCLAEKPYPGGVIFACRLLTSFFFSIRWLWRKIFRLSYSRDELSSDADRRGKLAKRGGNGAQCHESRGEKARRKAEEKRQARLEKELLEEEERKQREEVARLVEERRRLRDEKIEAEKDLSKSLLVTKEKDAKKSAAEKKRRERRKEKDRGSSKSNSDAEELDKRAGKETERKQEHQRPASENFKGHYMEMRPGAKNNSLSNVSRTSTGNKYFDQMKGTFLSSSKAFTGGSFFGKSITNPVIVAKENKSNSSVDHAASSVHMRDIYPSESVSGKSFVNGEDKKINHPFISELQPRTEPKKSWHQLFIGSSSVPPSLNVNATGSPNTQLKTDFQSSQLPSQVSSVKTFDNPVSFGLPSPSTVPTYRSGSTSSSLGFSPVIETILPHINERSCDFISEEPERFEDPCYVPDPISLLGPISESLDFRAGFATNAGQEKQHALRNASSSSSSSAEVNKPSPIESPLSRSRVADEKHSIKDGTWQMWRSPPLGHDGLGFVSGSASWLLSPEKNRSNKEEFLHHSPYNATSTSLFANEDPLLPSAYSPRKVFLGSGQSSGSSSLVTGPTNQCPWSRDVFCSPLSAKDGHLSLKPKEEGTCDGMTFWSPIGSTPDLSLGLSPADPWLKKGNKITGEGSTGNQCTGRPPFGGVYQNQDVQSFW